MEELERLRRRLNRERCARKEAESLLEQKSMELYQVNNNLKKIANNLELEVKIRTAELTVALNTAKSANNAKTQFLANMSHELRTPLNAIIGYSDLIIDSALGLPEQNLIDLKNIKQAGAHLLVIINEILDLAKIEAGKMEIHLDCTDPKYFLDRLTANVQSLALKNDNRFSVICSKDVSYFYTDEKRLMQILTNLLSNACKFTKNGDITLSVDKKLYNGNQQWLIFEVSDTGIGMTPEQLDTAFNVFVQVDSSVTRKYEGTGLGLTICKQFCKLLGGNIEVRSKINQGTTFIVSLPNEAEDLLLPLTNNG